jgi:hypothetical protein
MTRSAALAFPVLNCASLGVAALLCGGCASVHGVESTPRRADGGAGGSGSLADLATPAATAALAPSADMATTTTTTTACASGHYVGMLQGTVQIPGLISAAAHGTVDLTFGPPVGALLPMTSGHVGGSGYSADVKGTLDCGTRKLTMGTLQNGSVSASGFTLQFTGSLSADYDSTGAGSFVNGTWSVTETGGTGNGTGTWTAAHQ